MVEVWSVGSWWLKGTRWGLGAGNGRACMEVCCLLTSAAQTEIKLSPCQNFRQCLEGIGRGSTAQVPLSPQWEWWGKASGSCHSFSPLVRTRAMGYEGKTKSLHRGALIVHLQQAIKKQLLHLERSNGLKSHVPKQTEGFFVPVTFASHSSPCSSTIHYSQLFTSQLFQSPQCCPAKE